MRFDMICMVAAAVSKAAAAAAAAKPENGADLQERQFTILGDLDVDFEEIDNDKEEDGLEDADFDEKQYFSGQIDDHQEATHEAPQVHDEDADSVEGSDSPQMDDFADEDVESSAQESIEVPAPAARRPVGGRIAVPAPAPAAVAAAAPAPARAEPVPKKQAAPRPSARVSKTQSRAPAAVPARVKTETSPLPNKPMPKPMRQKQATKSIVAVPSPTKDTPRIFPAGPDLEVARPAAPAAPAPHEAYLNDPVSPPTQRSRPAYSNQLDLPTQRIVDNDDLDLPKQRVVEDEEDGFELPKQRISQESSYYYEDDGEAPVPAPAPRPRQSDRVRNRVSYPYPMDQMYDEPTQRIADDFEPHQRIVDEDMNKPAPPMVQRPSAPRQQEDDDFFNRIRKTFERMLGRDEDQAQSPNSMNQVENDIARQQPARDQEDQDDFFNEVRRTLEETIGGAENDEPQSAAAANSGSSSGWSSGYREFNSNINNNINNAGPAGSTEAQEDSDFFSELESMFGEDFGRLRLIIEGEDQTMSNESFFDDIRQELGLADEPEKLDSAKELQDLNDKTINVIRPEDEDYYKNQPRDQGATMLSSQLRYNDEDGGHEFEKRAAAADDCVGDCSTTFVKYHLAAPVSGARVQIMAQGSNTGVNADTPQHGKWLANNKYRTGGSEELYAAGETSPKDLKPAEMQGSTAAQVIPGYWSDTVYEYAYNIRPDGYNRYEVGCLCMDKMPCSCDRVDNLAYFADLKNSNTTKAKFTTAGRNNHVAINGTMDFNSLTEFNSTVYKETQEEMVQVEANNTDRYDRAQADSQFSSSGAVVTAPLLLLFVIVVGMVC